jgi:hypothetical protein
MELQQFAACSFRLAFQIGIRFVANPPDLRSQFLQLWKHCSMDCSFETADFLHGKRVHKL